MANLVCVPEISVLPPVLIFTAETWESPQNVDVYAHDNDIDDGVVAMVPMVHSITSSAFGYRDFQPWTPFSISVADDDDSSAALDVTASELTLYEGGSSVTYGVRLASPPREPVSVECFATNGDFSSWPLLAFEPTVLLFDRHSWSLVQYVAVSAVPNAVDADGVQVVIEHRVMNGSDPTYFAMSGTDRTPQISVTLIDDDEAGLDVSLVDPANGALYSSLSLSVTEGGTPGQLAISMRTRPTADVFITAYILADGEGDVLAAGVQTLPNNIVFVPGDWNITQLVEIRPLPDHTAELELSHHLSFVVTSDDPLYQGLTPPSLQIIVHDDEVASVLPSSTLVYVSEHNAAVYSLALSSQPITTAPIYVTATVNDPRFVITNGGATFTFNQNSWNISQTVEINVIDYSWHTNQDQWGCIVEHAVQTVDAQYGDIEVAQVQIVLEPRPPCDPVTDTINVVAQGAGLIDQNVMAGDETSFTIEASRVNSLLSTDTSMCVNSQLLINVELAPAFDSDDFAPDISVVTLPSGALFVTYRVYAWTQYTVIIKLDGSVASSHAVHNTARPAPVAAARFSNSLDSVHISFDVPIHNYAEVSAGDTCVSWLSPQTQEAFGTGMECAWESPQELVLMLGLDSTVDIGDTLDLSLSNIRSFNSESSTAPVIVDRALHAVRPQVVLHGPLRAGSCEVVTFDGAASLAASTAVLDLEWTLSAATRAIFTFSAVFGPLLSGVEQVLRAASTDDATSVSFDIGLLPPIEFSVLLSATNSHALEDVAQATTQVVADALPSVAIRGPSTITAALSEVVRIEGEAALNVQCGLESNTLSFSWELVRDTDDIRLPIATSSATFTSFDASTLEAGQTYTLTFAATTIEDLSNSASVSILIVHSPLVASLNGATRQQVSAGDTIVLDGSSSGDPDCNFFMAATCRDELDFSWSCSLANLAPCDVQPANGTMTWDVSSLSAVVGEYTFSLIVRHAATGRTSSTASIHLSVITEVGVPINLDMFSVSSNSQLQQSVNTRSDLVLHATLAMQTDADWLWSLDEAGYSVPFPGNCECIFKQNRGRTAMDEDGQPASVVPSCTDRKYICDIVLVSTCMRPRTHACVIIHTHTLSQYDNITSLLYVFCVRVHRGVTLNDR
eukprot:SAG11_NODE_202_length_12550_cov_5.549835_6_plen_1132_part_00